MVAYGARGDTAVRVVDNSVGILDSLPMHMLDLILVLAWGLFLEPEGEEPLQTQPNGGLERGPEPFATRSHTLQCNWAESLRRSRCRSIH